MYKFEIAAVFLGLGYSVADGQLMVVDAGIQGTANRVMLFNEQNGALIDANWITDAGALGWSFTTPIEARAIGAEIWVTDTLADAIFRFDRSRKFLGTITQHPNGGLIDRPGGLGFDGDRVYLTICSGDVAQRGVGIYDISGAPQQIIASNRCRADVEPFMGDLLLSVNTQGNGRIERWTTGGEYVGDFVTGLAGLGQMSIMPDNSVITTEWAVTYSSGVYHFEPDGTLLRFIDLAPLSYPSNPINPNGAYELGDGNYLIATSFGIYKYLVDNGAFETIVAGEFVNAQSITLLPEPSMTGMLALLSSLCMRRRRAQPPASRLRHRHHQRSPAHPPE